MQTEAIHALWLHQSQRVSLQELVALTGMAESEVHELIDAGALLPANPEALPWMFSADCVVTVRTANRLRHDLELDSHAVAVALTLLSQIRALESELAQLRARQPAFSRF